MSQAPAPIEFKNGLVKNDTSKYTIEESNDDKITSKTISLIPSENPQEDYLVKDTDEDTNKPVENNNAQPIATNKPSDKINTEKKDLDKELNSLLDEPKANSNVSAKQAEEKVKTMGQENNLSTPKIPEGLSENLSNPIQGKLIKSFSASNQGINISATLGEEVKSIYDGQVVYSGYDNKFGNLVIVKLKDSDLFAAFAHLDDLIINKGEQVAQGQLLGHVGQTGNIDAPQLYLALKKGKVAIDPLPYFRY
jgi:septal ring factor EnvC (AmiA/AmiB activator)